jgi:hypothetical protein
VATSGVVVWFFALSPLAGPAASGWPSVLAKVFTPIFAESRKR